MPHKTYPVLDKYTYQKPHQTDYSYKENLFEESENYIAPRLIYRRGASLIAEEELPMTLCDSGLPKNSFSFWRFGAHAVTLAGATGFGVSYRCDAPAQPKAVLRITLYGPTEDDAFMSVCNVAAGSHTALFDTARLPFAADVRRVKLDVVSLENVSHLHVQIDGVWAMQALDTFCRMPGQTDFYTVENAALCQNADGLRLDFAGAAALYSPVFPDSSATVCNMLMPRRNTIFLVLANDSDLAAVTVAYRTTMHDDWCEKQLPIRPHSPMTAYYCNLSDTPNCEGRLTQFALRTAGGRGAITLGRYTFEEEKPIRRLAGRVSACTADADGVRIQGVLAPQYADGTLLLYQTDPSDGDDGPDGKELVATLPATQQFAFAPLPLYHRGITRLSAQFLVLLRTPAGALMPVDERFAIQNIHDFIDDPYAFQNPDRVFNCLDFGAKGDAVADDTDAIQAAIDAAHAAGGGRVVVPGQDSFYGRRYIVTNLLLRSHVDLILEKGAVLWQSQQPSDYCYRPTYGHDGVIDGINWTHSLHICNLPILQAHNCEYVAVRGQGAIRSMDTGSEEGLDMPGYSCGCPDRIHQISIGFFNVEHVNLADFDILRANNYHISLYRCAWASVTGVRMHQVKCVSGDGIGLGKGSHHVLISGVMFQSNDDAVTLTACYHDPRGILWWSSAHDGRCGPHHVRIEHSYMNSGGGKAIAFLPWGTTQRYAHLAQVDNIEVYDCHLSCVSPVGAWADNPFAGAQPFDNTETDDYSPVCGVRILGNRYQGNCAVWPLQMTDFITDCGLHSADHFLNGDFSAGGPANWTVEGDVTMVGAPGKEHALLANGRLVQGLYLAAGRHTLYARLTAPQGACLVAQNAEDQTAPVSRLAVTGTGEFALTLDVDAPAMWYLGVESEAPAEVYGCRLCTGIDGEALSAAEKAAYQAALQKSFIWNDALIPHRNDTDGKLFLGLDAPVGRQVRMESVETLTDFEIEASFRVQEWRRQAKANSYGFLLRAGENGAYRFVFLESEHRLKIQYLAADGSVEDLYVRENFFFTSDDYHAYRLQVQGDAITFWVDNAKYAAVHDGRLQSGKAVIFGQDGRYLWRNIALTRLTLPQP